MGIWSNLKKWAFRDDSIVEVVAPTYDSMVGEPVISFIESLNREKNRRYLFSSITRQEYKADKHHWMGDSNFFQMIDRKTGTVFQLLLHDHCLYNVVGLPFDLNHWEKAALFNAWLKYRQPARQRWHRIVRSRMQREREAAQAQELLEREQFAKQFRENAV